MNEVDDAELVRRCTCGDSKAFELLLSRYEKTVFNASLRMLRNWDDAKDVTQTVFLKVFEHLEAYDPRFRFYSWIYRITLNESANLLNRRRHIEGVEDEAVASGPEDDLGVEQFRRELQDALMTLKPDYRAVIVLNHFLELSYRQMSEVLEVPEKTVKSRLFTARHLLRERLTARGML